VGVAEAVAARISGEERSTLAVTTTDVAYMRLLPGFVVFGVGMSLFFPPVAWLVLGSVRPEEAGQASGANMP